MAEVVTLLPGIQIYEKKGHMARYLLFLKIIIFIIFKIIIFNHIRFNHFLFLIFLKQAEMKELPCCIRRHEDNQKHKRLTVNI